MRDDLEPVQRPEPAQHPAAQHDQPAVLEHPHLAPVLGLVRRRRLLERLRGGLVDGAAAALHHQVRQRQVVAEARVDLDVVLPPHRVDRAVAAGDRAEPRLGVAHGHLVAPVDALLVRAVGGQEPEPPADVRDVGVGERAHEHAQRVGRPGAVRVGERDDLARRSAARRGPAPRPCRRADSRSPATPGYCSAISSVRSRRRVGGDDDLQLVARVVELEQVLDPPRDRRLLVVGGDDHRHRRLEVGLRARAAARRARAAPRTPDRGRASRRAGRATPRRGRRRDHGDGS